MELQEIWPLFGLRLRTSRVELRVPDDADLAALISVAARGVHPPEFMPFAVPWTDKLSPEFECSAIQHHWKCRAEFSPALWNLCFVVAVDGKIIGSQSLHAANFATLRSAETGSWLGMEFQGRGIGKRMRAAVVRFAFEYLDAAVITSGAFTDNPASHRVSLATGYEPNGVSRSVRRGVAAEQVLYRLTRDRWEATRTDEPLAVEGFDACRPMFGLN